MSLNEILHVAKLYVTATQFSYLELNCQWKSGTFNYKSEASCFLPNFNEFIHRTFITSAVASIAKFYINYLQTRT